jgi:hypothetical protein
MRREGEIICKAAEENFGTELGRVGWGMGVFSGLIHADRPRNAHWAVSFKCRFQQIHLEDSVPAFAELLQDVV